MARYDAKPSSKRSPANGLEFAAALIGDVCEVAGSASLIDDVRRELAAAGVIEAVGRRDDSVLFEWLLEVTSYQGISDRVAWDYMERHGNASYNDVAAGVQIVHQCSKLRSYWHFQRCGFRKSAQTCNEPDHFQACPLPRLPLRNGGLNQAAFDLFLFMRDIANGDFTNWVDTQLANVNKQPSPVRPKLLVDALIGPMRNIHALADKVLNMSLSMLLLGADPNRKRWTLAGANMVAIDTLVHNWLFRTGILYRLDADHQYGPRCYGDFGCGAVIRCVADRIDAKRFNPDFPAVFPRFVQHAIWRFCAQSGLDQCNANAVRDGTRCDQTDCALFDLCDRIVVTKPAAG